MLIPVRCFTCGKVGYFVQHRRTAAPQLGSVPQPHALILSNPCAWPSGLRRSWETSTIRMQSSSWRSRSTRGAHLLSCLSSPAFGDTTPFLCSEAMDRLKLKRYCCRRMILVRYRMQLCVRVSSCDTPFALPLIFPDTRRPDRETAGVPNVSSQRHIWAQKIGRPRHLAHSLTCEVSGFLRGSVYSCPRAISMCRVLIKHAPLPIDLGARCCC